MALLKEPKELEAGEKPLITDARSKKSLGIALEERLSKTKLKSLILAVMMIPYLNKEFLFYIFTIL